MDTLTAVERSERMSRVHSRGNRTTKLRLSALFREHRITGWRRGSALPENQILFSARKDLQCLWTVVSGIAVRITGGCPKHVWPFGLLNSRATLSEIVK